MDGIFTNQLEAAGALASSHLMAIEQGDSELKKVTLADLETFMQRSRRTVFLNALFLIASNKRELTIKAGTKLSINSQSYERTFFAITDVALNLQTILDTGNVANGKDYYLYLCPTPNGTEFKASLSKTNPLGYAAVDVNNFGGCHTLCANAGSGMTYQMGGSTLQHPLNGFLAGDILPQSVWCLNHRPFSEAEGMVYIPTVDVWVDIYFMSGSGFNTKSVYQGAITRSRQYVDFVEDLLCVKKALLNDEEFAAAMMGSNEKTNVGANNGQTASTEAAATSGGAGGRVDTANRRMLSIYGVEEGCGSLWQWLATTAAAGVDGTFHGMLDETPSYGWMYPNVNAYGPYPQSGGKGSIYGIVCALLAGGSWANGSNCGSRSRHGYGSRSGISASVGGRGRSRPRIITV